MGALPRLKKKVEYRYRKGSTNESCNCKWCASFVKDVTLCGGGKIIDLGPRCKIFGMEQSIRYRIREDHTCDAQQSTYRNPFEEAKPCKA